MNDAIYATLARADGLLTLAQDAADSPESKTLFAYIREGGNVGYVILLLSLVAAGMIITQLITMRRNRLVPPEAVERLAGLLSAHDVPASLRYCEEEGPDCLLTRTMGGALARCSRSPFGFLELPAAVEEIGKQEVARLGRVTDGIGLVASIAPMLGLLGTVIGMVGAFDVIAQTEGPVRPDQLAGNISEALITTVLGLIVAIPTTAAHTYLRNRIEHLAAEAGEVIEALSSHLQTAPAGNQARAAVARSAGAAGNQPMQAVRAGNAPGTPTPNPSAAPVRRAAPPPAGNGGAVGNRGGGA